MNAIIQAAERQIGAKQEIGLQPLIHMEGELAAKFHSLLADIYDTVLSLETAANSFPKLTIERGEMHPAFTVQGFTKVLESKISTAMDITNSEDEEQEREDE